MSTIKTTTLSTQGGSTVPVDTVVNGTAKAWVNFNGAGTVAIRRAFNVSSITDTAVGVYRVNFTTAMPDANYAVISGPADWTTLGVSAASDATTSSVQLISRRPDNAGAQDREIVAVTIFS